MSISATSGVLWALDGFKDFDGNVEGESAEVFDGIGFASRPASGDNAEVIALKVGGESGHPVIVATRNRDSFKVLQEGEGLAEGETAIYTGESMVKIKADGTIELGSIGGVRQALATLGDIENLKAVFDAWVVPGTDGGAALKTALEAWTPTGTTKVRGE
tara:strand:- start:394 stop:873 length:480 start_codon:yes stop_codon:yes gene_type:complete